jgi:hypothetical protein
MPNYSNAKIYKVQCPTGHYYIGSTTSRLLCERLAGHRRDAKKEGNRNNKLYSHFNTIGWDKATITLLESVICTNGDDLKKKENEYLITALEDELCLNRRIAYRDPNHRPDVPIAVCACGSEFPSNNTQRHLGTLKHHLAMVALEAAGLSVNPSGE